MLIKGVTRDEIEEATKWVGGLALTQWTADATVQATYSDLRRLSDCLVNTTDMRVMELVMFHGYEQSI